MGVQLPGALLCSWGTAGLGALGGILDRPEDTALPVPMPIRGTTLSLPTSGRPCACIPYAIRRRTHLSLSRYAPTPSLRKQANMTHSSTEGVHARPWHPGYCEWRLSDPRSLVATYTLRSHLRSPRTYKLFQTNFALLDPNFEGVYPKK